VLTDIELANLGPVYSQVHNVNVVETVWQELSLADGATDTAVAFAGVTTADVVLIASDRQITWRQALTDTATTIDAGGYALLCKSGMTALYLTNASGAAALVKVFLGGA